MQVQYCDLCGTPMKEGNYYSLYISGPGPTDRGNISDTEEYLRYLNQVRQEIKEICPTCKHIFNKMFELRLQRLNELTEEINNMYDTPSKKNPKERKNDKDKK